MGSAKVDRFETIDGVPLSVRPIEPDDKAALSEAFRHLSEESVYKRFLSPLKRLTTSELAYLTELDHAEHEALIALTEMGEIVGVARYVRDRAGSTRAEAAIAVQDEWQGRGVGSTLLGLLADRARANGVERFTGICLAENRKMIQLFDELGPTTKRHPSDSETVEVEVTLPTGTLEAIPPALRMAAKAHPGSD